MNHISQGNKSRRIKFQEVQETSLFHFVFSSFLFNFFMVSELLTMEDHSTNVTPLQDSGEISTTGSSLSIGQNTSQMMNQSFLSLGQLLQSNSIVITSLSGVIKCLMWSLQAGLMMFLMEPDHVLHYFYLIQILPLPQQSNLWL